MLGGTQATYAASAWTEWHDDGDRLNTARRDWPNRNRRAAETKRTTHRCLHSRVAIEVWHEDRQPNARVERPADALSSAWPAQYGGRAGRAPAMRVSRTARTR